MTSINPTLTGSGKAQIAAGASLTLLEVAPKLTVSGALVRAEGPAGHQRIHQAGWVALGYDGGGSGPDLITWSRFIGLDYEDFRLPANITGDSYFWDLTSGTTVQLEIDW